VQFLWLLDELLYPAYRQVVLRDPVFILAPPRTGSTSLHRALSCDEAAFFAPVTIELFLPFITLCKLCHAARRSARARRLLELASRSLTAAVGIHAGEVTQRHPMGLFDHEEDDIALTVHHVTSEICWCAVSHRESFLWGAHAHALPRATRVRGALFLTRLYQKVAFCRGSGRRLVTKSHLVGLLPELQEAHPGAQFVTILRPAAASFPSFWSLQCAISRDFGGIDSRGREYLGMRLAFMRELHCELLRAFGQPKRNRTLLVFDSFVADPAAAVALLYTQWGVTFDEPSLRSRVARYLEAEEHAHPFGNSSWAEIGVTAAELPELVNCPLLALSRGSESPAGAPRGKIKR
jgi:hypothetical protein